MSSEDLYKASEAGDLNEVKRILQQQQSAGSPIVNAVADSDGCTALTLAAKYAHLEVVKHLVQEAGAGKDKESKDGWTALMWAAMLGNLEVVKYLVQEAGADKEKRSRSGDTALMLAAGSGHLEVVKYLVQEAGADKDKEKADRLSYTGLIVAASRGHLAMVQYLVEEEARADKERVGKDGNTALMLAALKGHLEVVRYLVQAGADKDKAGKDGSTALMRAAEQGHLEVVKYLVQAGADKEKEDKDGKTALDFADKEQVKCLLRGSPPATGTSRFATTLLAECGCILQQVASASQRRDFIQRTNSLQAQLEAAENALEFVSVASLGTQLEALKQQQQQSVQLPLSEEDYLTLSARHADLVHRMTEKCRGLALAEEFTALTRLGAKLSELRAAVPPEIDGNSATSLPSGNDKRQSAASCEALLCLTDQCAAVQKQAAFVPQRSDIRQRLQALQAKYDTALVAAVDFVLVGTLGTQLQALQQESAQLPLSEEDYQTLGDRHAELVRRVTDTCRELMRAGDYAVLGPLSAKLKELKALDLSGIAGTSHDSDGEHDPVVASGPVVRDDDGESDPVIVTPARQG